MDQIKIAIADDHKILRDGLKVLLNEIGNIEILFEASSGEELLELLKTYKPQLLICDIRMPGMGGEDAIRIVKEKYSEIKIIVLSMFNDEYHYSKMIELGVDGYIIKESDYEELDRAINTIIKGGKYFSQQLLMNLLENRSTEKVQIILTDREKEILKLLCLGLSTQEIADRLLLGVRTVEKHRSEMLLRTGSSNSISLVVFAIRNGLVVI